MKFQKVQLPDLGEGITEGEIVKIHVSVGDSISMDQVLLEVMTDKASMEVPSSIEGMVQKIHVKEGDIIEVGADILSLEGEGLQGSASEKTLNETNKQEASSQNNSQANNQKPSSQNNNQKNTSKNNASFYSENSKVLAIPATRKLAQELNISLEEISKAGDRVTREDLLNHIKNQKNNSQNNSQSTKAKPPLEIEGGEVKREALIGIKRLMFESMSHSKNTIPHFTILESADASHLVSVRNSLKDRLKDQGLKLTYLSFIMKAVLSTIKEFPIFNSSYDEKTKELVYKKACHLGFATDSPQGLLVPVIKEAQDKSVLEITKEIKNLSDQVRDGSIKRENLKNASITITNVGSIGGLYGTPIINSPEVAILGVYRLHKQVCKKSASEFEERDFINFSVTCDHRFIDGATATRFLKSFVAKIEEPSLLILD